MIQLGHYPDVDNLFDMLPVDVCASLIVRISQQAAPIQQQRNNKRRLDTFHLTNDQAPNALSVRQIAACINSIPSSSSPSAATVYALKPLPYSKWKTLLFDTCNEKKEKNSNNDNALYPLLSYFEGPGFPSTGRAFSCANTIMILDEEEKGQRQGTDTTKDKNKFEWPIITQDIISRYVAFYGRAGMMNK